MAIALVLTSGFAAVVLSLAHQVSNDNELINLLGRQRMLAQLMGKSLMNEVMIRHMGQDISLLFIEGDHPFSEHLVQFSEEGELSLNGKRVNTESIQAISPSLSLLLNDWGDIKSMKVSHLSTSPLAQDNAPLDSIDKEAYGYLQRSPKEMFYREVKNGEVRSLRFYVAHIGDPSCLECHQIKEGSLVGIKRIDVIPGVDILDVTPFGVTVDGYPHALAMFETSFRALKEGGLYPQDVKMSAWNEISPLSDDAMIAKMAEIEAVLDVFKNAADGMLSGQAGDLALWRAHFFLSRQTDQLRDLSDDLVNVYAQISERRHEYLLVAVVTLALMMITAYLVLYMVVNTSVFKPLRKVLGGDVDFAEYEKAEQMRLQVQQELSDSEARFKRLAEATTEGVMIHDKGKIVDCNRALSGLTGYSYEELIGMDSFSMLEPESLERVKQKNAEGFEGTYEMVFRNKDGVSIDVEAGVRQMPYEGRQVRVVAIHDIRERKRSEEARLAAAEKYRVTLVQEVHHRIKNTLQGIAGLLRQKAQLNPQALAPIEEAISQVSSVAVVMGLEGTGGDQQVNLCGLAGALINTNEEVSNKRIKFDDQCKTGCRVMISRDEATPVALILNELIMNAVKHGDPDVLIGIETQCFRSKAERCTASVIIRNGGVLPKTGVDITKGVGLGTGLTLVKSLLPPQGANIEITEENGEIKAVFYLESPIIA